MDALFHIARAEDWRQAQRDGVYRISTLGRTLEEQGYIHLSFAHQVKLVADRFYRTAGELRLLRLDPARIASGPVVVEAADGIDERFPHLYGAISLDAVTEVSDYRPGSDGTFPAIG